MSLTVDPECIRDCADLNEMTVEGFDIPSADRPISISSPKSSASSGLSAWQPIQKEVRPTGDDVGPDLAVTATGFGAVPP